MYDIVSIYGNLPTCDSEILILKIPFEYLDIKINSKWNIGSYLLILQFYSLYIFDQYLCNNTFKLINILKLLLK